MRRRAIIVVGVFVLVGAGFGVAALTGGVKQHPQVCTRMGCRSGVSVDIKRVSKELPNARRIDVCVAGKCTHNTVYETGRPEGQYVPKSFNYAEREARKLHGLGPYPVSVTVATQRGTVLLRAYGTVTMRRYYPNGKGCGGPCFVAGLKLNTTTQALEPLPRRMLSS